MDLYTKIQNILTSNSECRNSYRELRWRVWTNEGSVVCNSMTKSQYMSATDDETIRRTAQKVVENHPELGATGDVRRQRKEKEKLGGHFVWNNQKKEYSKEFLEDALAVLRMKWKNAKREGEEWEKDLAKGKQYRKMLDDLNTEFVSNLFKGN